MSMLFLVVTAALLGTTLAPASMAPASAEATVKTFLEAYDRAFNAKDLGNLAAFYHPDVTIFEGGHVNTGWIDYRDNHLGPELKEMEDLQFAHVDEDQTRRALHPARGNDGTS